MSTFESDRAGVYYNVEKLSILKKEQAIEGQKVCKQVRDQRSMETNKRLKCCYIMKNRTFKIQYIMGSTKISALKMTH